MKYDLEVKQNASKIGIPRKTGQSAKIDLLVAPHLTVVNIHTTDRILPEYQNKQIGTPIFCMSGSFCPSAVHVLEPNHWFGWQATDETGIPVWIFVLGLFHESANFTRLMEWRGSLSYTFSKLRKQKASAELLEKPQ